MGIVVVTGSSTGIGQATAITLARGGHAVFAAMRNLDRSGELRGLRRRKSYRLTSCSLMSIATTPLNMLSSRF
jgi:NAD(P)-dependent dehydrogenase (short-subunit alcohol dehydrogenase family)